MTKQETPAEVLADIDKLIADNPQHSASVGGFKTYRGHLIDLRDRLSRSLAAGKVEPAQWQRRFRFHSGAPWSGWETFNSLEELEHAMAPYDDSDWQCEKRALYTAPPADPAKASGSAPEVTDALMWLRGALDCPSFAWDADQWEAAEAALTAALQQEGNSHG